MLEVLIWSNLVCLCSFLYSNCHSFTFSLFSGWTDNKRKEQIIHPFQAGRCWRRKSRMIFIFHGSFFPSEIKNCTIVSCVLWNQYWINQVKKTLHVKEKEEFILNSNRHTKRAGSYDQASTLYLPLSTISLWIFSASSLLMLPHFTKARKMAWRMSSGTRRAGPHM